jgi:molybdopterin/thiamine biosynthesis adenylyltransferase
MGDEGQAKLKKAKVLVIGAGGFRLSRFYNI